MTAAVAIAVADLEETNCLKSSQVNTLLKAKSKIRSKQNKDLHKFSSVYSERGVPLPVLTRMTWPRPPRISPGGPCLVRGAERN